MEVALLLGLLGYGAHQMIGHPETDKTENKTLIKNEQVLIPDDNTLASIDWSKAGNFLQTSHEHNIVWVMISE
jgi:hypothetical protein